MISLLFVFSNVSRINVIVETVPDYSKLTLTQTKRMEMDSQVRVLELESNLTKEREKLGQLRRIHYQLAAAEEEVPEKEQQEN